MRLIVLGGSGFVGRAVKDHFACMGTSYSVREGFTVLDATNVSDLRRTIQRSRPDVVVNCVGLADVDRAEREPNLAEALNLRVVENIAAVGRELPFRLVHISTDYVFDGTRGMYREADATTPINEYGRSKLRGEAAALAMQDSLILRISSPYGHGFEGRKPQFFRYVTDSLRAGKKVRALVDQRVSATFLPDLTRATELLVSTDVRGIVHVASLEPMSRFSFAKKVAKMIGAEGDLVSPGTLEEMTQWVARRPADTSLDVSLSERLGVKYTPTEDALRLLLSDDQLR